MFAAAAAVAVSCALGATALSGTASADSGGRHDDHSTQTVYTLSNNPAGNEVLAFRQDGGVLTPLGNYATGGTGTGTGLGSQGSVIVEDHWLFAVNAGSNDVSVFRIERDGSLVLTDRESTAGVTPVSITEHDDIVYVLNSGDESVTGLRLTRGDLRPIPGAHQVLAGAGGAQISFDREGKQLVVTEKATNTIVVLPVRRGVAQPGVTTASAGNTPFGFAIDRRNHVFVTNAEGGAAGASSVSSYDLDRRGGLRAVSPQVATTQTAACWLALSEDGGFAYDTNAGSASISQFAVGRDGSLTLVNAVAGIAGAGAADLVVEGNDLFTRNGGARTITLHEIQADGSLLALGSVAIPAGTVGIAAS